MKRMLGEFADPAQTARALKELKAAGHRDLEAYLPYYSEVVSEALELKKSPLPWLCFGAGVLGAAVAYTIMWWTEVIDFPLNIGGRPHHALPAFIPITFETIVLFAGTTTFIAGLLLAGLPRLHHPIFQAPGFERVTVDRFLVSVAYQDEQQARTLALTLQQLGASQVVDLEQLERELPKLPEQQ